MLNPSELFHHFNACVIFLATNQGNRCQDASEIDKRQKKKQLGYFKSSKNESLAQTNI